MYITMQRKTIRIGVGVVLLLVLILIGIPTYYWARYPYQLQHAEQTSLSTKPWEPLLLLMKSNPTDQAEKLMAVDCEAYHGNWKKVQELSMADQGSVFLAYYHNLALAYQGLLADSLMHHYAPFERALFLPVDETGNYRTFLAAGEAWWAVGDLTMAEHATMLGLIFSPRHTGTRALHRLAEINIAQGDSAAAAKYLRILKKCPRHRKWAEYKMSQLDGLQLRDGADTLRLSLQYQKSLRNVLDNNPYHPIAHEYLLCLDLLLKDLVSFRQDVERYGHSVGRVYEEAILILMANDEELREAWHDYVSADTYEDFTRFSTIAQQNETIAALRQFEGTYWFYFKFAKRNDK